MARHLFDRFLLTLPALWLVLTLVFLLIHIVPGDPVEQMLGEGAAPGQVAELRHSLGLDRPVLVQYGRYLWEVAHGDLGQSLKFQAPVRHIIFERYPATMQLAFLALLVCAEARDDGDVSGTQELVEKRLVDADDVSHQSEVDRIGSGARHDARRTLDRAQSERAGAVQSERQHQVLLR